MFTNKEELITVLPISLANAITDHEDHIIDQIIRESIALMTSYLSKIYDTNAIFSASGDQRNLTVLKYLKDIVVFELYRSHTRDTNEAASERYEAALQWLRDLNTGALEDGSLPLKPTPPEQDPATSGNVRFGGPSHYQSQY